MNRDQFFGDVETGQKVIRSVYKVKRADNTNTYDRIHFETDSKMVCDATHLATANVVARRDGTGSIWFNNLTTNGNLEVKGTSKLTGVVNALNNLSVTGDILGKKGLTIDGVSTLKGAASLRSTLAVAGATTLNAATTINSTLLTTGNITTNSKYFLPGANIGKDSNLIKFIISDTTVSGFDFNKAVSIAGAANLKSTLSVTGAANFSSTIVANGSITTNQTIKLPGCEIKKDLTTVRFDLDNNASAFNFNKATGFDGAATFRDNLSVVGEGIFQKGVSVGTDLTVNRNLINKGTATITGKVMGASDIETSGRFLLSGGSIERASNSIAFKNTLSNITDFYFSKPLRFDANSSVSVNLNADKVDGKDVNDGITTADNLWTAKKIDDTKISKGIRVNTGEGLSGGGALNTANLTITHATPGAVVRKLGVKAVYEMIRAVNLDKFGHVASLETADMTNVFASYEEVSEMIANANITVNGQFIRHTDTDVMGNPTGPARNDVNNVNMKNYSIDYSTVGGGCIQFSFV